MRALINYLLSGVRRIKAEFRRRREYRQTLEFIYCRDLEITFHVLGDKDTAYISVKDRLSGRMADAVGIKGEEMKMILRAANHLRERTW